VKILGPQMVRDQKKFGNRWCRENVNFAKRSCHGGLNRLKKNYVIKARGGAESGSRLGCWNGLRRPCTPYLYTFQQ